MFGLLFLLGEPVSKRFSSKSVLICSMSTRTPVKYKKRFNPEPSIGATMQGIQKLPFSKDLGAYSFSGIDSKFNGKL